jgi:cyclophilin family peptidyl-prolyl cis-trans isomerase
MLPAKLLLPLGEGRGEAAWRFLTRFQITQRTTFALVITFFYVVPLTSAQTVRFETSAGTFELLLNPTNDPRLQGHVDNLLQYVLSGRYDGTVINRADEGFVLQMGSYDVLNAEMPETIDGFIRIETFPPVAGVPAAEVGLANIIGTVGLALPASAGGTLQDAGTSSFYINLTNNSPYLDADFTVFAQIADMTTINAIMGLSQVDLTLDPDFGASPNNLGFTDVPLLPNGDLVLVSRAFVVPEPAVASSWVWALAVYISHRLRPRSAALPGRQADDLSQPHSVRVVHGEYRDGSSPSGRDAHESMI